jgi:hypothetical protein
MFKTHKLFASENLGENFGYLAWRSESGTQEFFETSSFATG